MGPCPRGLEKFRLVRVHLNSSPTLILGGKRFTLRCPPCPGAAIHVGQNGKGLGRLTTLIKVA